MGDSAIALRIRPPKLKHQREKTLFPATACVSGHEAQSTHAQEAWFAPAHRGDVLCASERISYDVGTRF